MYSYEIGYGSYEDSNYIQLTHEKQFTEEEFDEMVYACVESVMEEVKIQCAIPRKKLLNKTESEHPYIGWYCGYDESFHLNFEAIHELVAEYMCSKFDFKPLKFQQRFNVFGWCNLNNSEHFRADTRNVPRIDKLREIVQKGFADVDLHPSHSYKTIRDELNNERIK